MPSARGPVGLHRSRGQSTRLPPARTVWLVAVGGGTGTRARVAVSAAGPTAEATWPWSTLVVNVSGAFALAVLLTTVTERIAVQSWVRPLVGTGLLGAYTTFSTLSFETQRLAVVGRAHVAVAYAALSVAAGLAASVAGIVVVRRTQRRGGTPR